MPNTPIQQPDAKIVKLVKPGANKDDPVTETRVSIRPDSTVRHTLQNARVPRGYDLRREDASFLSPRQNMYDSVADGEVLYAIPAMVVGRTCNE